MACVSNEDVSLERLTYRDSFPVGQAFQPDPTVCQPGKADLREVAQWQQLIFFADGGTSLAGLQAKKPFGLSMKPM